MKQAKAKPKLQYAALKNDPTMNERYTVEVKNRFEVRRNAMGVVEESFGHNSSGVVTETGKKSKEEVDDRRNHRIDKEEAENL